MCKQPFCYVLLNVNCSHVTVQDILGDAEEKIEKLISQKADYEQQLKEMDERLLDQEDESGELSEKNKKLNDEMKDLKADVDDLENSLSKVCLTLTNSARLLSVFVLCSRFQICHSSIP